MVLIIKKFIIMLLCLSLFCSLSATAFADGPATSARCAVLMSGDGQIIYAKNADQRALIASTTKLMTAIVAIEQLDLSTTVEIKSEWCGIEGSSMYLKPGDELSVEDLLYGLLLVSGNDAAVALACITAGDIEGFAVLMNQKAEELEMTDSSFENPHGLDSDKHYSSAADMAKLMAYCMDNPHFARLIGTFSHEVGVQTLVNHNKLLQSCPGCTGGKTGYTKAAGRCLVSCCERDDTRLICVTLSAPDDWNDHVNLYKWGFDNYCSRDAAEGIEFSVPVVSGDVKAVSVTPAEEIRVFCRKDDTLHAVAELPHFVFAPVEKGQPAGKLSIILDGKFVGECPLVYAEDAAQLDIA